MKCIRTLSLKMLPPDSALKNSVSWLMLELTNMKLKTSKMCSLSAFTMRMTVHMLIMFGLRPW